MRQCRSTVHVLYKALSLLEAARLPLPERRAWIAVDVAALADTVLALSDLQAVCQALDRRPPAPPEARELGILCSRIRWLTTAMTMTILKCPGDADAQSVRRGLEVRMCRLNAMAFAMPPPKASGPRPAPPRRRPRARLHALLGPDARRRAGPVHDPAADAGFGARGNRKRHRQRSGSPGRHAQGVALPHDSRQVAGMMESKGKPDSSYTSDCIYLYNNFLILPRWQSSAHRFSSSFGGHLDSRHVSGPLRRYRSGVGSMR